MQDRPTSSCIHAARLQRAVCAVVFCFFLALPSLPSIAVAQQTETEIIDDGHAEHAAEPEGPSPEEKKRVVTVAFMLWWGIVFVGLGMLTVLILWGIRTRRIARTRLPAQSRNDDLWYLKSKQKIADDDSEEPESAETGDVEP